ncbi:L,D-transpeptidase [Paenibacillus sepulcri]|uniref:L,D-transpeptidase n=1 Tax=Paenibacillus sepulcri TaxID=359917 RepID=A0ABS7C988_9BACL|nr:L,D-transpeptidase [Paenibacillus sepulcri]
MIGNTGDALSADPSLPIVNEQGIYSIEVFPLKHQLVVSMQGQKFRTYSVAVGNPTTPTPVGEYQVMYKGKNWGASYGPRWLGLNVPWGYYGIHGTNKPYSIGQHQSHGCIRMHNRDVWTSVKIVDTDFFLTLPDRGTYVRSQKACYTLS